MAPREYSLVDRADSSRSPSLRLPAPHRPIHALIRKGAHVFEYAVLAMLWRRAVGAPWPSFGLAVITAALDEFHQSFEPGRGASIYDVLLDGTAAAAALALGAAWRTRRRIAAS